MNTFAALPTLKGMTIVAFAQTETQSTGPCGIILVEKPDGDHVTAWHRLGDSGWHHGNYFTAYPGMSEAQMDALKLNAYANFLNRVRAAKRIPAPEAVRAVTF